jgi:hypothetical protein
MKRNRFVNFLLSLEEEMTLGKYRVQKKFVVIGVLGIGIYLFMTLYTSNSPRMGNLGKNGNKEYNELMSEQEKIAEEEMKSFAEKPEEVKTYEQNMKEILSMSDDEIRELLKSQNMYLSDEDIAKFREDVRKNMPKTQEEAMRNAEEFKNFEETTMKQVYEEAKKMAEEETKKKGE